ncbi:MAG: cytochrome c maturation protein CcmE [Bacteroides sp.]|jgi:cytochrome c-type biogenesis protein CcmE|nr:cytochrome c maturation protein CcmE [Bacteroides sp.]
MKKTHIIALIFIVIAIGAIISTVYNADTYASFEVARKHPGREFHIIGELLKDKPIEEKIVSNTLLLTFHMTDNQGAESQVTYFGAKPQDFEKSDQVVLIGSFKEDAFVASSLLLKCPSKYNADEFEETTYSSTGY